MDAKKLIFWGTITIAIVLLLFNWKINTYKEPFDKGCNIDYSSYLKSNICPCVKPSITYGSAFSGSSNKNYSLK